MPSKIAVTSHREGAHTRGDLSTHRVPGRRARAVVAFVAAAVAALAGTVACLNRPLCDVDCRPRTTNQFLAAVAGGGVDKIDLLFMIDNSASMDDKQKVLQLAVPDLVRRLVSPRCVDPTTGAPPAKDVTPDDPKLDCPAPYLREFTAIRDIHVGIVSSSLGDHGDGHTCTPMKEDDPQDQQLNDHGWLIGSRSRFTAPAGEMALNPLGFLDWNPTTSSAESLDTFNTTFAAMTLATGSVGCGYESQLEAMYRFLVDPSPYASMVQQTCRGGSGTCAYPSGRDDTLLKQRAAFLRPDSLVAVIMLTDENDCSIQDSAQGYYISSSQALPQAASICATNPNDKCCYSCGGTAPPGCPADPVCAGKPAQKDDPPGLRCFEQAQRFGLDFLYPTARYVNALKEPIICTSRMDLAPDAANCPDLDQDRKPDLHPNPLFQTDTAATRLPSLVFFAGIVGVPWQDLVTKEKPDGTPYENPAELHYQTATQLKANLTWDKILGDGNPGMNAPPVLPTDALMQESRAPRGGLDGETPAQQLAGTDALPFANPVNGHEWSNPGNQDLQYACIFPLTEPKPCGARTATNNGCDCTTGDLASNNPLCQDTQGGYSQPTQYYAKAYPGLRELQVLKDFGDNSIVASICARNVVNADAQDFGYRPAVDAIVDRLKAALTGSCLPRALTRDENGNLPCSIVEARPKPTAGTPACSATPGRLDPDPNVIAPAIDQLRKSGRCDVSGAPACTEFYVCQIKEAGEDCHTGAPPTEAGWCYIDPYKQPGDNAALVSNCGPTEKRAIHFVDPDHRTPEHDAIALVACFGSAIGESDQTPAPAASTSAGAGGAATGP